MTKPDLDGLAEAALALRAWQHDGPSVPLHPGDLGWHWRFGAAATAAALRTWSRDGQILAVGLLDGPRLLRLAIAPGAEHDEALAAELAVDLTQPERGVLPDGTVSVEARFGGPLVPRLLDTGWSTGDPWTPLSRDLSAPVEGCGVRIEVAGPDQAGVRAAIQRAAFEGSTFTEERWYAMAAGPPYADARCLIAYDDVDTPVAAVTVWSAGPRKPGLLEPMGVHREHRGRGYGTAVTLAAAAALRELGSSSATVCTASSNVGAVATYRAAGFRQLPVARDLDRIAEA